MKFFFHVSSMVINVFFNHYKEDMVTERKGKELYLSV